MVTPVVLGSMFEMLFKILGVPEARYKRWIWYRQIWQSEDANEFFTHMVEMEVEMLVV